MHSRLTRIWHDWRSFVLFIAGLVIKQFTQMPVRRMQDSKGIRGFVFDLRVRQYSDHTNKTNKGDSLLNYFVWN